MAPCPSDWNLDASGVSRAAKLPEHRDCWHGGVVWGDRWRYKASDALKGDCHDGVAFRSVPRLRPADHFVVHFDLPGVDPNSIELTVERNALTVKAERSWHPVEGDEVIASERPSGTFSRQ